MIDKQLQRVTDCLSDIGQPSSRRALPPRRNHITQKVRTAGQRTLYISVHDDPSPAEIFLRVKGSDCTPETIALHDGIARLMSVALQYGASPPSKSSEISSQAPNLTHAGLCQDTIA